tara:strand:+ start:175 stop:357 length:183 start_codon:yes stop_codon:yes gene_type:complete
MKEETGGYILMITVIALLAAWVTHIIHCLVYAKYLLLIAGGFIFPVGVVHGIGIWFGVGW